MADHKHNLDAIQRWMQTVIMHPGGIEYAAESSEARAHIDLGGSSLEAIISPSQQQSSAERLEIYAHAYYARLVECLSAEFPVFAQFVGEDAFGEFAVAYLQRFPSRSYTLNQLGASFAAYLRETCPEDEDAAWPGLLIDLAAYEWNVSEVFDGPGTERQPPFDASQLERVDGERWPAARLATAPCLRLLELAYPVHDFYRELRSGGEPSMPGPQRTLIALSRQQYVVRHWELAQPQFDLLAALIAGRTVGEAIVLAAASSSDPPESFASQLQSWFRDWAAEGFFTSVELAD